MSPYYPPAGGGDSGALDTHIADATDPHAASDYATEGYADGAVTTHAGAADPHTGYVLESLFDAKGDMLAASADNTPAKVTVGADGTVLQALASASPGVRWAGAPLAIGFFRSTVGANQNLSMHRDGTDGQFIVPVGWILAIVALSGYSPLTTANTGTLKVMVDDADQSASFGACTLAASTTDATASAEPTAPPFLVDATSARKRITIQLVTSNSGGGNANFSGSILGYLYKP